MTASLLCVCLLSAAKPQDAFSRVVVRAVSRAGIPPAPIELLQSGDVLPGLRTRQAVSVGISPAPIEPLQSGDVLPSLRTPQAVSAGPQVDPGAEKNQALLSGLSSIAEGLKPERSAQRLNLAFDNNADEPGTDVEETDDEQLTPASAPVAPQKDPSAAEEATQALFRLRHSVKKDAYAILKGQLGGDIGDGILHRDVERILRRLLKAAGLPREAAQVYIGNSMLPNAFTTIAPSEAHYLKENASPAKAFRISNIFISLGLLRSLESEDQLAFVIAHELMHNWKNHLKDFSGAGQRLLGHFHELEADAEGLKLAAAAGYKPQAAIDSLYALDREYDRLEKQYALLKRDKSEVAEVLQQLRDIHPHSDIRRANMMDHMNQALEAYRADPSPHADPVWMRRRQAAERPSHIDRFASRLEHSVSGATVEESIYSLETFIERELAHGSIDREKYAVIEEAYRKLLKRSDSPDSLRPVETSMNREGQGDVFPSRRLKSSLISRQLDIVFKNIGEPVALDKFLKAAASLSAETRRAGTLRLLGTVRDRQQLEAIFKTLSSEAESLGFDLKKREVSAALMLNVGKRIWRATRRVMSAELGRPALPEEIIAEMIKKLSPSWLKSYRTAIHVEIIESAFGPEAARSKKYRPSQLAALLNGTLSSFSVDRPWENSAGGFTGLQDWSNRHYVPPALRLVNRKYVFAYERYDLDRLSSASLQDQLDIAMWFGESKLPPPAVRLLRSEGTLDAFIEAAYAAFAAELKRRIKGAATLEERRKHLDWYQDKAGKFLRATLYNLRDFKTIRETSAAAWRQVEILVESPEINAVYGESNRSQLVSQFFSSMSLAIRQAVVGTDLAGLRPDVDEIRQTAALVSRIEKFLRTFPSAQLVKAYADHLGAHIGKDRPYMEAYRLALPDVVEGTLTRYEKWLHEEDHTWTKPLVFILTRIDQGAVAVKKWSKKRWGKQTLPGIPEDALRPLDTNDYVHFLAMIGDPQIDARTKLMAAALLDRLDMLNDRNEKDRMGRNIGMRAAAAAGRWLFEDVSVASESAEGLSATSKILLRLNDLHPGLFNPDFETTGTTDNAFREGAEYIKRNEAYRSVAKGEHPFRGVNTRWALELAKRLDAARAWPRDFSDRLDLLDFFNSNGEFSDELDHRLIEAARLDPKAFLAWIKKDRRRLKLMDGGITGDSHISTPFGLLPVPKAQPLKIVRNPALRTKLFDLLPESKLGEQPPRRSFKEWYSATRRLIKAYFQARKHFSAEFLRGLRSEGSMEDKIFDVLEEVDRNAAEKARLARQRWNKGEFTKDDRVFLENYNLSEPERQWRTLLAHTKDIVVKDYKDKTKGELTSILWELYNAYAGLEDPILGLIVDNYPEPTRSRDDLLERLIKARKLTPGSLSHLEANKSYRQPNPVRIMEKHLLDQAVIQMRKFSPAEKVDILLHLAKIERLSPEKQKQYNKRILNGERKKMARDDASLRSIFQLENYMSLLHAKDRALLTRALFYGEGALHKSPADVSRLFERLVIVNRNLPPFMEKVFRAYFKILTEDERAKLIADLAALEEVGPGLKGPEIVQVTLRGMGVTGKKVAQVLATHKGLVPEEYAAALEGFKDRAQDMEKMRAHSLITGRLGAIERGRRDREPARASWAAVVKNLGAKAWDWLLSLVWKRASPPAAGAVLSFAQLDALSREALPEDNEEMSLGAAARRQLIKQVSFLLREQKAKVRWIERMGPELGAGSIKMVYKVILEDDRVWVVKLRAPGAAFGTQREFEIFDSLIATMQKDGDLDLPAAGQLLDEVKSLVQAEMNFVDEKDKELAMLERTRLRPWYARLVSPRPYVPKPHPIYIGEDLMIEEFVTTTRFSDLPKRALIGPSKASISRLAVREGMFQLVYDEWLEPDPHTGNRHARKGGINSFWSKLVVMDLGQGSAQPIERLRPLMKAGLALEGADAASAARSLLSIVKVPEKHTEAEILSAIETGLSRRGEEGLVERMMDGLLEAEKLGALVAPEYAPLQKAFLIYTGYSEFLPKDYIFKSLEEAVAARLWHDRPISRAHLLRMGIKKMLMGRGAVRAELNNLLDGLKSGLGAPALERRAPFAQYAGS